MISKQSNLAAKLKASLTKLSVPVCLLLALSFGLPQEIQAEDSNNLKLNKIEKILFFKTYDEEPLDIRVGRLEKRYYGEASQGDLTTRIDKIYKLAKPQIEAANEKDSAALSQATVDSGSENSQNPKMRTDFRESNQDKELDKKRLAVLQARDEEIRVLLKDGIKYWKKRDAKNAEEKFLQVVRLDPRNDAAFFSLGVLYEAKGKLNLALKNYNNAHNINPNRLDYKDAIVVVKASLEKQKKKSQLAIDAAQAFKRKEYISALELYKRLEKQNPKKAIYKYNIGTIYLLMKSPEQALEYYGKAKKLSPKEPRFIRAYEKLNKVIQDNEAARVAREREWDRHEKIRRINEQKNFSQRRAPAMPPGQNRRPMPPNNQNSFNRPVPGLQQNNGKPMKMPLQVADNYFRSIGVTVGPAPSGIKINTVEIGSRAALAGIRPGDIVISVNGQGVLGIGHMATLMSSNRNGQKTQLIVKRQGQVGQILF